jgi:hypothetical protein
MCRLSTVPLDVPGASNIISDAFSTQECGRNAVFTAGQEVICEMVLCSLYTRRMPAANPSRILPSCPGRAEGGIGLLFSDIASSSGRGGDADRCLRA